MDPSFSSSATASPAPAASTSGSPAPGKTTRSAQLPAGNAPAGTSPLPPELAPLVGLTVSDGGGYTFVLEPDGAFVVIATPRGKEGALHKRVTATSSDARLVQAWKTLAAKIAAEHPAPAPSTASAPAPASTSAAPAAPASSLDSLLAGLSAVGSAVTSGAEALGAAVTSGATAIGSAITGGLDAAGTFVGDLLAGLVDGIGGAITGANGGATRGAAEAPGVTAPGTIGDGGASASPAGPASPASPAAGEPGEAPAATPAPGTGPAPAPASSVPPPAQIPVAPGKHTSRSSFVKPGMPPSVTDHPTTSALIDTIWPYFDAGDVMIGGYLSPGQQAWKVNYHWELVIWCCDHAQGLAITDAHKASFAAIATSLRGLAPSPASGYLDDAQMAIVDTSDQVACDARYAAVKQAKVDLGAAIAASGATAHLTGYAVDRFKLAPQYVKPAGTSKHGTGYAFDIKGDNARITATGASLGMSGHDDEDYHVHVEFAAGARPPALDKHGS